MTDRERGAGETPFSDDREVRIDVYRIGPSGGGGRSPVVVGGFLAVLVAVVGLAVFGGRGSDGEPAASAAALASGDATVRPSRSPRPTRPPTPRPELPGLPNDDLPGSPAVVLGRQVGEDVELRAWWAGQDDFTPVGRLPGVMADQSESEGYTSVDLAPIRHDDVGPPLAAAVRFAYESDVSIRSRASIVGPGGTLWESEEASFGLQTVWSGDGSALAVGGTPVWSIVRIAPDGTATAVEVRVADDPQPNASASPAINPFEQHFPLPIGFSASGRWLYGAVYHEQSPSFRVAVRVDLTVDPPLVEPIDRLPGGNSGDRLVSTGYSADSFDPATGRMAEVTYDGPTPRLRIFEPDGADATEPLLALAVQSTTWLADGDLLITAFSPDGPEAHLGAAEVFRFDLDEEAGTYLTGAARVNGAWTAGTLAGFALVMFWAEQEVEFVMLRTGDGATGSIRMAAPEFMSLDLVAR